MRRFVCITTFRNPGDKLNDCLNSLASQDYDDFDVVCVDDASTDGSREIAAAWCDANLWTLIARDERMGALANQIDAIRLGCTDPEDVIVWVDGDDRLARTDTFDILNRYYDTGVKMTFGSYRPEPPDAGCAPARPFPGKVVRNNAYRKAILPRERGGLGVGHCTNHLRTMKYELFLAMDDADFRDNQGRMFMNTPDIVLMVPALELAGPGGHAFVPEELLVYSSDLPSAEWRTVPRDVDAVNLCVLRRPAKDPLP